MDLVGLDEDALDAYPSQFSGGQRQRHRDRPRAGRPARRSSSPTSPSRRWTCRSRRPSSSCSSPCAAELGLSVLFIAHNLAVVQHLVDRIAVMYLGRIVEVSPTPPSSSPHPSTRTRRPSSPPSRGCARRTSTSRRPSRVSRRAPSTCPPGAASTRGVPTRNRPACPRTHRWWTSASDMRRACLSRGRRAPAPLDHGSEGVRVKVWTCRSTWRVSPASSTGTQCRARAVPGYELGCRLMLGEVNAAIEGALRRRGRQRSCSTTRTARCATSTRDALAGGAALPLRPAQAAAT